MSKPHIYKDSITTLVLGKNPLKVVLQMDEMLLELSYRLTAFKIIHGAQHSYSEHLPVSFFKNAGSQYLVEWVSGFKKRMQTAFYIINDQVLFTVKRKEYLT